MFSPFFRTRLRQQPVRKLYHEVGKGGRKSDVNTNEKRGGEKEEMQTIFIAAATACITSVVCCRISALVTFRIIDKYVVDMIETAKESIRNTYINKRST